MTGFVVIDTEGSGLFRYRDADGKPVPADHPDQPRLAELAMLFLDDDLGPQEEHHFYVRPDGWEMTEEATAVNGLRTEFLMEYGVPVADVLVAYAAAIQSGRVVIAFNAQHDLKQMRAELRRADMDDMFLITKNICAMRGCQPLEIKKANGKKGWPKLSDACVHFGIAQPDEHNAMDDARAAAEVARHLMRLELLPEPAIHLAKGRD
jgi:DNA polymerase III epsilon subunit-like protein